MRAMKDRISVREQYLRVNGRRDPSAVAGKIRPLISAPGRSLLFGLMRCAL